MDINCYALEVITKSRLAQLRADAARYRLLASLRTPQPGVWAALRSALHRTGRRTSNRALSRGQVLNSRMSVPDSAPAQSRLRGPDAGFQDLTPLTRR